MSKKLVLDSLIALPIFSKFNPPERIIFSLSAISEIKLQSNDFPVPPLKSLSKVSKSQYFELYFSKSLFLLELIEKAFIVSSLIYSMILGLSSPWSWT
jgi:hypothetical protein